MEDFFKLIVSGSAGAVIIWLFIKSFLEEKGKNLADKQDIGEITKIVQEVINQYAMILENFKLYNQLKLAALEKRMGIYQKGYTLWSDICANLYDRKKIKEIVEQCQKWWYSNCLYLDKDSREKFREAYIAASMYIDFVESTHDSKLIKENWDKISEAGKALEKAVGLPVIADVEKELEDIRKKGEQPWQF
jgi:hypothetical protein